MPTATVFIAAAAAAAGPLPTTLPDIELNARVRAREVRIQQQGEARLRAWAEPSAGDKVDVERNLPKGQRRYRNLDIKVTAEARIAAPAARASGDASQQGE